MGSDVEEPSEISGAKVAQNVPNPIFLISVCYKVVSILVSKVVL